MSASSSIVDCLLKSMLLVPFNSLLNARRPPAETRIRFRLAVDGSDFNGDLHASPGYRAHLVMVMARRAVVAARQD